MNSRLTRRAAVAGAALLICAAIGPAAKQAAKPGTNGNPKQADSEAGPTPRLADGHPDLNGVWDAWAGHVIQSDAQAKAGIGETEKNGSVIVLYDQNRALAERAKGASGPTDGPQRPRGPMPSYKPELVAKYHDLQTRQNRLDPIYQCKAPGVPRIGPPQEIVETNREVVFIYSDLTGNYWRVIPTDGRPHNTDADPSYLGDSIGRWEGDTLVVDDTNFTDDTWLSNGGTFHSDALHVTERLTRNGDHLQYEVAVEDPKVLSEAWHPQPRTLKISDERLEEAPPCKDMDQQHFVTLDHH